MESKSKCSTYLQSCQLLAATRRLWANPLPKSKKANVADILDDVAA